MNGKEEMISRELTQREYLNGLVKTPPETTESSELATLKFRLANYEYLISNFESNKESKCAEIDLDKSFTQSVHQCKFAPLGCFYEGYRADLLKHESDYVSHQIIMMNTILKQNRIIEELKTDNRMLKNAFNHCSVIMEAKGSSCNSSNTCSASSITLATRSNLSMESSVNSEEQEESPFDRFKDKNFSKLVEFVESEEDRRIELSECSRRLGKLEESLREFDTNLVKQCSDFESCHERLDEVSKDVKFVSDKFIDYFTRFTELEKAIDTQKSSTNEKYDELNALENCFDELETSLEVVKRKHQEHDDRILSLTLSKGQIYDLLGNQEKRIVDTIGRLTSKTLILSSHTCSYVWKIENFSRKQEEVRTGENSHGYICSNPFYTNEFGYKMTLNVDPNGFGNGYGTHLSCFLHLMKGPMDSILKWPVEYTAKFILMDQVAGKAHHSSEIAVSFQNSTHKAALSRPVSEENPGCGIHQFISLGFLKPLYLVDDTLYLMVEINIKM